MKKPKKVKEKKKEEDNFDFMKTNKDNINNVIKDKTILVKKYLNMVVIQMRIHLFLKLYII
jgi:hypothetical protein